MAKKPVVSKNTAPAPAPADPGGEVSLASIRNKMAQRYDPKAAPPELQMMYGAATDAAGQSDFGPDVWGRIWSEQAVTIPNARGERAKTFGWRIDEGARGDCCIAEIPVPLAVHVVNIGWRETKRGSFFARERIRCLARRYEADARGGSHVVPTGVHCPFCQVLGPDRWRAISVGGVIDMREDQGPEPFIGPDGKVLETPPRILVLDNDAAQRAVADGLLERHVRGKPMVGTVFHVSRGTGKNTSRVGTNWIPDLDITVPKSEIAKIYAPINMAKAFPILHEKAQNQFEAKEMKEVIQHILERHVSLCVKYKDKMAGRFVGYDEKGALDAGLDLKAIKEQAGTPAEEEDTDTPASRGLRIMGVQDTSANGPSLRDLADKTQEAPAHEAPAPEAPAAEEGDVTRDDIVSMTTEELKNIAKGWEIPLPKKSDDDAKRMAILTSPKGFAMVKEEAEGLLGLIAPEEEAVEATAEEAVPEEAVEAAEEAVDVDALKAHLLDAGTKIAEVIETAKGYHVEPVFNEKKQVLRAKTVDAIVAALSKGDPWKP